MKISLPGLLARSPSPAGNQSPLEPGLYSYPWQSNGQKAKIHLRVDPGGKGLLLINANRAFHLNPSATFMAYFILEGKTESDAIAALRKTYKVSLKKAKADFGLLSAQIKELIRPDGACPIHDLDLDVLPPFSQIPTAPYRMDLALTYRCNCDCAHCYNARPRNYPEMDTAHWQQIIERLWQIGVPHITFTGGEPTMRNDLPELIAYAEAQGQITGLLTNGRRLSDASFLETLIDAGLDHVQITIESHDPAIHDSMMRSPGAWQETVAGIRNALEQGLYVMTNTTLLKSNSPFIANTIDFLADIGVPTIGCNSLIYSGHGASVKTGLHETELPALLDLVHERTNFHGQRLVWYTPTQYCHFDPVQMELGVKGCTAALYNMCVEPDGGVIPCQSYYHQVGNILEDSWDSIWNHDLCIRLRERKYVPEKCRDCPFLDICGGGCPLALEHMQPGDHPTELIMH